MKREDAYRNEAVGLNRQIEQRDAALGSKAHGDTTTVEDIATEEDIAAEEDLT